VPKQISTQMKNFLACTMNFNIDKRYDWKKLMDDPFVKIQYCEDIRSNNIVNYSNVELPKKINDSQIETLAENITFKAESIYKYFSEMFKNEKNSFERMKYSKFTKEMNVFILLFVTELRIFRNLILKKNSYSKEGPELHIFKVLRNDYKFSCFNFSS